MNSTPKLSLIIARSFRLVCRKYSAYLTSKWDQLSAITAASAVKIVLSFLGMRSTESMQFVRYSCCHVWCWLRDTKTWQHLKIILVFWSTPNPRFVAAYKNKKGLGRKAAINRCYKMRCVDGKRILGNPGATRRIVSISSAALPQSCVTSQKTAAAETTRRIRRDEATLYFRANIFAIPSHATRCFGVCVTEEKSHLCPFNLLDVRCSRVFDRVKPEVDEKRRSRDPWSSVISKRALNSMWQLFRFSSKRKRKPLAAVYLCRCYFPFFASIT